VEFRIYGFNAATGSGTLEVDEVWLQGGASPVPEPAAALLGGMGVLTLLRRRRH
jgi:MYXO-CTERM domain-containing protein